MLYIECFLIFLHLKLTNYNCSWICPCPGKMLDNYGFPPYGGHGYLWVFMGAHTAHRETLMVRRAGFHSHKYSYSCSHIHPIQIWMFNLFPQQKISYVPNFSLLAKICPIKMLTGSFILSGKIYTITKPIVVCSF